MINIDTHIHLGGTIPTEAVWKIVRKDMPYLAESHLDIIESMTYKAIEPKSFHRFLDKFRILDEIKWTPEAIDLSIEAICDYFAMHNMSYVWLDFSINKYMEVGWHKHEAIKFIYDRFQDYYPDKVGLILSLKYESPRTNQLKYSKILEHDVSQYLIGLDLVGNEEHFDEDFYRPIISEWKNAGKIVRAHVGESQTISNIKSAIDMGVTNIAHGFKIVNDENLMDLAKHSDVTFDLSLISNYMTGVYTSDDHPILEMVNRGLKVTLGSDDPVIFGSSLSKEFEYAKDIGLSEEQITEIRSLAVDNTRNMLVSQGRKISF